jgi:hypothetical protein
MLLGTSFGHHPLSLVLFLFANIAGREKNNRGKTSPDEQIQRDAVSSETLPKLVVTSLFIPVPSFAATEFLPLYRHELEDIGLGMRL